MKKLNSVCLFLLIAMFSPLFASADLGPQPGYHGVNLCTKIYYKKEFLDIFVISQFTQTMYSGKEGNIVEDGECISGYKYANLNLYYFPKNKLSAIDLKNLSVNDDSIATDLYLLKSDVEHYGGDVKDSNHLVKQIVEYALTKNSQGKISLYKAKETFEYNNGDPVKVKNYSNPNPVKKLEVKKEQQNENYGQEKKNIEEPKDFKPIEVQQKKKKGFWYRFMCVFGIGSEC